MSNITPEEARSMLATLFHEAGREQQELILYIEKLEQSNAELREELLRLKQSSARRAQASTAMNSRLKDALRE
ncbi:hypothetical protein [Paenibacillus sp. HB172176]|uniref:hypothetical protein n=1 Tax=Paenibacillus sp. HB172176 TaxID=2493690 RepID=UPI00143B0FA2|nr:hypothetical protein [Paenibacillus sp. HB172176]